MNPKLIYIDAGHGGTDPGAVGAQAREKDINLAITLKTKELLEKEGVQVVLTRTDDGGLYKETDGNKKRADLNRRCEIIEENQVDFVVSIHQNSYTSPQIKGAQVFYYTTSKESQELAETVQKTLIEQVDPDNHRQAKANDSYYLLKKTESAIIIVECGFLSNPEEAQKLTEEAYQQQMADAICTGIFQYLGKDTDTKDRDTNTQS